MGKLTHRKEIFLKKKKSLPNGSCLLLLEQWDMKKKFLNSHLPQTSMRMHKTYSNLHPTSFHIHCYQSSMNNSTDHTGIASNLDDSPALGFVHASSASSSVSSQDNSNGMLSCCFSQEIWSTRLLRWRTHPPSWWRHLRWWQCRSLATREATSVSYARMESEESERKQEIL